MLFRKPRVEIIKENTTAPLYLSELESLLSQTKDEVLINKIEKDIALIKAGIYGEESILYELKNSPIDLVVIQDLYIEMGELSAQIDFIVITPRVNIVIECKNLYGNIEINSKGDFIRTINVGKRYIKEGIYSPITQNERHLQIIKNKRTEDAGLLKTLYMNSGFEDVWKPLVVLANDKTVLNDKYAKSEIKSKIIRCDQLLNTIVRIDNEAKTFPTSFENMVKTGMLIKNMGSIHKVDYTLKYKEEIKQQEDTASIQKDDTSNICPHCGKELVLRTATKGSNAGNKFWGCSGFPMCRYIKNT